MSKKSTIQELEKLKDDLLKSLSLPDRIASSLVPQVLAQTDAGALCSLMEKLAEPSGVFGHEPEFTEFLSDFVQRSEDGLRQCLESEIGLLRKALETGEEQVEHTAFGALQGVFPVLFEGEPVHALISGRLRDKPFSDQEIADIATVSGMDADTIKEAAGAIPVLSVNQANRVFDLFRAMKTALEQALTDRTHYASLNHQLVQSERTRSLGTLSGGVAHHFNNLLSVILGYSSFVLNREDHSKEASSALHKIAEAAQRGRRLTEEILAFAGSDQEEESPCRVHETLTNVLSLLESELSTQTRIERALQADHDTVLSPPSAVHQIVFNLITNAIDSMPAGGVLTVATSNVALDSEQGKTEYLKLEVTDSSGMLPEGFEEGSPDDEIGRQLQAGDRSGLKLSNVYGMVGRMDGTMMVSTEPGALTRVEVLLPTAESGRKPDVEKRVRRRLAPSEIWVVDDDEIFREMCNQVLSEEGHTLVEITGGQQLHLCWNNKKKAPNLIIMDFSMPEYNGLELCEWLKAHGSNVPVILVSGFSQKQPDIKKALKIRKTYFLQKPFTSRDLTDSVTVAMGETLIGE